MINGTIDTEDLLTELNNEKARMFIPAMVYVGLLMLIGVSGNFMVLYFYGCVIKSTPSTSFIFTLAIFDIASCLVGMPMEIADLRYYFNFKNETACKILRCLTHFTSISSAITLLAIAVDRYRRICKPFHRQIDTKHVKFICFLIGVFSVILSAPAVFFNKVVQISVPNDHQVELIGRDCTTTKAEDLKHYLLAFNAVYLIAFVIITIILAIIYSLIGRQLCRHQKFRSYVAKGGTKVRKIQVRASQDSNENLLSYRREASTLSNKVFGDPPDATDSIVDMKEFVTRGLTQVETNRPSSGYTAVTGTTGLTGLTGTTGITDISGKSRRTLQSMKSVTICDPSQNQIFPIEARVINLRKTVSKSDSIWSSIDGRRPGSAGSFTSVSTRPLSPNSTATTKYTNNYYIKNGNDFYPENSAETNANDNDDVMDGSDVIEENDDDETMALADDRDGDFNEELDLPIIEHDIDEITDGEDTELCIPDETNEDVTENINQDFKLVEITDDRSTKDYLKAKLDAKAGAIHVDNGAKNRWNQGAYADKDNLKERGVPNDEGMDIEHVTDNITDGINEINHGYEEEVDDIGMNSKDSNEENTNAADVAKDNIKAEVDSTNSEKRPSSKNSGRSDKTKSSKGSRRTAVVSPMSCKTTSSMASRASTVKKMKRMLKKNPKLRGIANNDSDKMKELRLKMLDLNTVKYTFIMIVITIVFVMSFLPYLALVIWRHYQDEHEMYTLTDTELVLFQIGVRSIFLNSALNPLIYGGFNSKFRTFFYKSLCCKCLTRKRKSVFRPRDQSDSTSGS
ncbi:hypothetical protein ACF0H5_022479 [Mactra antiquata]